MEYLQDIIDYGLKILFIGFNPGLRSAGIGHHYANKSNNFWKLLFESGLTPYKFNPEEDKKLIEIGYGSTNIAGRPTRSASEVSSSEYKEGSIILKNLLEKYKPQIACYVGIGVYRIFTRKQDVRCGIQTCSSVDGVVDYVCPSPSGLNRMTYSVKLEHFKGLKNLLYEIL